MELDQESLLLPYLEGLGLFSEARVGELVLLFDVCLFAVEDVHLLAVPGVVVAWIGQRNCLGQEIGLLVEDAVLYPLLEFHQPLVH